MIAQIKKYRDDDSLAWALTRELARRYLPYRVRKYMRDRLPIDVSHWIP